MNKHTKKRPDFTEERKLWVNGVKYIAGVDEVGRGCFAGPVVAAAVILPSEFNATDEINDSKVLTADKREKLSKIIKENALAFSIAEISVEIINQLGIGKATQQAFSLAITKLQKEPEHILIDAFYIATIAKTKQTPIIHGDGISISIAAASIIAKVYRDERMQDLHFEYPQYDFYTNKGYGTKKHQSAIKKNGLCELHRKSFNLQKFV
jgi:ribonuclease HII